MASREKLLEFTAWCQNHITGDEKGQALIFLDRLFQSFGQAGCLDVGGSTEFRIRKAEPVTAPGMPKNYPDATKLVTEDCIRPVALATATRSAK